MATDPRPGAVPFAEAIAYLRDKLLLPTRAWTDLWQEQHAVAFTVAGAQSIALVADFHAAVLAAIEGGETLASFRARFDEIVAKHGWSYNGSRGWRSRVIFNTNLRMAYQAGRWQQADRLKATRPYLRYSAILDNRTRPLHRAWHGTILPIGDAWWQQHYPPNGWHCRCTVMSLSERDLARRNWKVSDPAPASPIVMVPVPGRGIEAVPKGIDPGFAYNPGAAGLRAMAVRYAEHQVAQLPAVLRPAATDAMAQAARQANELLLQDEPPAPEDAG